MPASPVRIPQETYGPCKRCGVVGLLGDGLCSQCYDRQGEDKQFYRQVALAVQMWRNGSTLEEIAQATGLAPGTAWRIVRRYRRHGGG